MGRVLVADDHDALRRGLVRGLIEAGHEVEEASNGNAAIERLHDNYFDVVLSDLKMGGSDGMDVLRTTRALHPTTAVILMTAFGTVNTAVEAMKIGAFDYVLKPFEIEEMEVKIEKALEMRRMRGQPALTLRERLRMRVGEIIFQRRMRQRDHFGDAVLGDLSRRRFGRIARDDCDRFAAALLRQVEASVNGGQRSLGEMSPLMLREN